MGLETTMAETARFIANPCPAKPPWASANPWCAKPPPPKPWPPPANGVHCRPTRTQLCRLAVVAMPRTIAIAAAITC